MATRLGIYAYASLYLSICSSVYHSILLCLSVCLRVYVSFCHRLIVRLMHLSIYTFPFVILYAEVVTISTRSQASFWKCPGFHADPSKRPSAQVFSSAHAANEVMPRIWLVCLVARGTASGFFSQSGGCETLALASIGLSPV